MSQKEDTDDVLSWLDRRKKKQSLCRGQTLDPEINKCAISNNLVDQLQSSTLKTSQPTRNVKLAQR